MEMLTNTQQGGGMSQAPSVERRLILTLFVIAGIAIGGVLAILPYRLYSRDIQQASADAHRLSSVVHVALSHALLREELDQASLTDLVNRLQGMGNVEVRLRSLEPGELHPAATSGKGSSTRRDTELVYIAPPITDRLGKTWLATMEFDLSPMKRRSIRLITDLVLAVAIGSLGFSAVIFLLIRRNLLLPVHSITEGIREIADGQRDASIKMPEFSSEEMIVLAREIERACEARGPA
jgi:methyl-accepting chemotaxis protein